jgi:hypothetical protein
MANTTGEPAQDVRTQYAPFPTYLVSQRASSLQATTLASAVSTAYNSADIEKLRAITVEIMNTLNGLGFWKGAA